MNKQLITLLIILGLVSSVMANPFLEDLTKSFKDGKIKGTIGTYMEATDLDGADDDFEWGTGYLYLKYETADFYNLRFGAAFLGQFDISLYGAERA